MARRSELSDHPAPLTTGQATQATTIFTTALNSLPAIETQIDDAQTAMATAIKEATATITTQANTIGILEGQAIAIKAKADAAFYLLLTADQKTKLDSLGTGFSARTGGYSHPGRTLG